MDQEPLVAEAIDAGAQLARKYDEFRPVRAALWVKPSEAPRRYLYLAADNISGETIREAYGELRVAKEAVPYFYLDLSSVQLIPTSHPLAEAAIGRLKVHRGPHPIRYGETHFGQMGVDDVYIYPLPQPAAVE